MVLQAATHAKGGSGPSGLDAEGWRRILCSSTFGTTNLDLQSPSEIIGTTAKNGVVPDATVLGHFLDWTLAPRTLPRGHIPDRQFPDE